jgi:integrase/recombinase XerD
VLKVFCQFLVEEGLLEKNPAQGIKMSMPGKTANIPPLEEVKRFINALDMKSFTDRRLRVMLLLALDTGLRRGELCGLKQSDIDKDRLALTVCAEYSKVRKSRLVPISLSVFKELKNFISIIPKEWNTPWLFPSNNGQKLDPSNLGLQMRRVAQKVGYDLKLHGLRHLCATEFLRKSGNIVLVSRLLGHSSIRVTADIYEHLNFNDLQSAHSSAGVVSAVLGNKRIRKV